MIEDPKMVSIAALLAVPANAKQLAIHQATEKPHIDRYARLSAAHAPAIWIGADLFIFDGFHRVAAAIARGETEILAAVIRE